MELLGAWKSSYSLRYVPVTLVGVVFSAGTIFFLSAIQASSGTRLAKVPFSHSLAQAELCIKYLQESGQSFQCANDIADILENLLRESRLRDRTESAMPLHDAATAHELPMMTPGYPHAAETTFIPQSPQSYFPGATHNPWTPISDLSAPCMGLYDQAYRMMPDYSPDHNVAGPSSGLAFSTHAGTFMSMGSGEMHPIGLQGRIFFERSWLEPDFGVLASGETRPPQSGVEEPEGTLQALGQQSYTLNMGLGGLNGSN
jgi:hypothetical protein